MLLSPTIVSLHRCAGSHPNRLHIRPPIRNLLQDFVLLRYNLAMQGGTSQPEMEDNGRR
jgi:hypothetical protein